MGSRWCCPKKESDHLQSDEELNSVENDEFPVTAVSAWDDHTRRLDSQDTKGNKQLECKSPISSDCMPPPSGLVKQYDEVPRHSLDVLHFSGESKSTLSCLQHIADREPEDVEADPSLNPLKKTLFMKISARDVEINLRKQLYNQQQEIKNRDCSARQSLPPIFDEHLHPIQTAPLPKNYRSLDPTHQQIYNFVHNIFDIAQLNAECAIVTLVYIERLLTSTEAELSPVTWRRAILCAILLASKVWDDQAVWNVDYCKILSDLRVNDINELERQFLEIIQFNINVPSSVYAKYYFDIRSLNGASLETCQLSLEKAAELEAYSRVVNNSFRARNQHLHKPPLWGSLDKLTNHVKVSNAVLS